MVFRFWVSGEKDKLRERGSCGEIETELGVTVRELEREKVGLGLKSWEGGETETAVAVAVIDEILRTSAMSARRSLFPYRSTLSLSRSILKLGLFFSFSFLVFKIKTI
jgi:hypothetical protein